MSIADSESDFAKDRAALRDLPKIRSVSDITSRALYQAPLPFKPKHENREFGRIITPYKIKDVKIQCGIQGCGVPHFNGYLILTSDGIETNIGKDCGTDHLGADFKEQIKKYERLFELSSKIEGIVLAKSKAPELHSELIALKPQYLMLKEKRVRFRAAISASDNNRLNNRVSARDWGVYEYRLLTGREREAYFEANPRARQSQAVPEAKTKIDEIEGMDFFLVSRESEEAIGMILPLEEIIGATEEDIYLWRQGQIQETHKNLYRIETLVSHLKMNIAQGLRLFRKTNLAKFEAISIEAPNHLFE